MGSEGKSFVRIFTAGCLWGTIGVFVKLMESRGSSSSYTSFLRLLFGSVILALITLILDGPKAFMIGKNTLISCILLGTVSRGLFNVCYSTSIRMNGMSVASVLLYTAPVFTAVMSFILFGERLDGKKKAALFINLTGCALTATGGKLGVVALAPVGLLAGIGAGLTYGTTPVFGRIAMKEKSSPLAVAAYNLAFGCIFVALFSRPWDTATVIVSGKLILYGVLFGLIPTALANGIYFSGLSGITRTSRVPVVASVELVVANIIGLLAFRESFSVVRGIGIVMVLISIALFSGGGAGQEK